MTKVFTIDFHMHPGIPDLRIERKLHLGDIEQNLQLLMEKINVSEINKAVVMLLDEEWFADKAYEKLISIYKKNNWSEKLIFCAMFDYFRLFEEEEITKQIEKASSYGVKGIKIHPVIQRITKNDFNKLIPIAKKVEELNMFTIIHCYGDNLNSSENIGLDIVSLLAQEIKTPIIIAHAGGYDFSRALFIAKEYSNVFIDFSYIMKDLDIESLIMAAIRSIGDEKLLYASDHPSCDAVNYKNEFLAILNKLKLTETQIKNIMGLNALKIIENTGKYHE
ncbi:MAG: amidohydrolase family protein [bacterium]